MELGTSSSHRSVQATSAYLAGVVAFTHLGQATSASENECPQTPEATDWQASFECRSCRMRCLDAMSDFTRPETLIQPTCSASSKCRYLESQAQKSC
jgi:hypothetical protein